MASRPKSRRISAYLFYTTIQLLPSNLHATMIRSWRWSDLVIMDCESPQISAWLIGCPSFPPWPLSSSSQNVQSCLRARAPEKLIFPNRILSFLQIQCILRGSTWSQPSWIIEFTFCDFTPVMFNSLFF